MEQIQLPAADQRKLHCLTKLCAGKKIMRLACCIIKDIQDCTVVENYNSRVMLQTV